MAEFLVTGRDGTDAGARARRAAARAAHLEHAVRLAADGRLRHAVALLDETGAMVGSVMAFDVPDRAALEALLAVDPYVTGDVWRTVEVTPCRTPPLFARGG